MPISKAKKALIALKERVVSFEYFEEEVKRTNDEDTFADSIKCKNDIKILIEAYEKQVALNRTLNKKVCAQRGQLNVLYKRRKDKQQ